MPTYYSFPEKAAVSKDSTKSSSTTDSPPGMVRNTKSFTRLDSSPARPTPLKTELEIPQEDGAASSTASSPISEDEGSTPYSGPIPEGFDELPVEVLNLIDRFIDSLSQKTYPAPLSAANLSNLFQDFYLVAFEHVRTHISSLYIALSSRKKTAQKGTPEQQMLSLSEISQKKRDRRMLEAKRLALEEAVERKVCETIYDRIWRHKSTEDEARDESLRSKMAALHLVGVKLDHLGVGGVEDEDMIEALAPARDALFSMSEMRSPLAKLNLLRQAHKSIVDVLASRNSDSSADRILPTLIFCLIHSPPDVKIISDLYFIQRFRASKAVNGEAAYCLTNLEAAISFLETVDLATLKVESDGAVEGRAKMVEKDPLSQGSFQGTPEVQVTPMTPTNETFKQPAGNTTTTRGRKPVRELTLNNRARSETPFTPAEDPLSNLSDKLITAKINHSLKAAEEAWEQEVARTPSPTMTRFGPDALKMPASTATTTTTATAATNAPTAVTTSPKSRPLSYITNPAADLAGTVVNTADVGLKTIGNTLNQTINLFWGQKAEMPKTLEEARKLVEPTPAVTSDGSISPESLLPQQGNSSGTPIRRTNSRESLVSKSGSIRSIDRGGGNVITKTATPPLGNPMNLPSAAFGAVGSSFTRITGMNMMRGFNRSSSSVNLEKEKDKSTIPSTTTSATATPTSRTPLSHTNMTAHNATVLPIPAIDLLSTFPDLKSPLLRSTSALTTATMASIISEESIPPTPPPRPGQGVERQPPMFPEVVTRFMECEDVGELTIREVGELLAEYKRLGSWVRGVEGN